MTNTKFRKRVLLSSVAMLLVALVALGSATFAWFVDSPLADAKGLNATAETSTGLLVKTETDTTFSHHAALANSVTGVVLSPATTNDGSNYYTVDAAASTAAAPDTSKNWSSAAVLAHTGGTGVYHEVMTLTLTTPMTGSETKDVNLTGLVMNLNTSHKYKDAVVVVIKAGSTVQYFKRSGATTWSTWNTLSTSTAATTSADKAMGSSTVGAAASITPIKMGTFSASVTTIDVDMYVFLDGQNSEVYTDNADASAMITGNGIEAYFSI